MRIGLGTALLLAASSLVGLSPSPVAAATGCDAPDTTWVGPAQGGSASWAEPTNWTNGVPTATSVVCIPTATTGPQVLEGTQAEAGTVALNGVLTVAGSLDVATLEGDFGELHGPGTTTVTSRIFGDWLTFEGAAVVDLPGPASLGGELHVYDGSTLNVHGDTILEPDARIDSLSASPGLFTITESGSLTFDTPNEFADVIGGFANHGAVTVTAGNVLMMGADPEDAHSAQFSTGTFTGAPGAELNVSNTQLRTGARIDHATLIDHISVPLDSTVIVVDSTLNWDPEEFDPNLMGEGELVAIDSTVGGRIGGSITLRVPVDEVVTMGDAVVQGQARIRVDGELVQSGDIDLNDAAVLDVYGTHRAVGGGGFVESWGADPGVEIIHPEGRLLCDEGSLLGIYTPVVNHGTVDSGSGVVVFAPRVASPEPSSGTFHAGPPGNLYLGDAHVDPPDLVLDSATIEGPVQVAGPVAGSGLQVRGRLETYPPSDTHPGGELVLGGTTTLEDGASVAGNVTVSGQVQSDPGATGTATLSGAEVTGDVVAMSGTLSVSDLAPTTLTEDGTLTQGQWRAWDGATLDLPAVTTVDAELVTFGPGASFGDGLATLTGIGPNGFLLLGGGDLAVPGPLRNQGMLALMSGSRLDVGGKFRQQATGTLYTHLDSAGRGVVRAAGPRDLAGTLWVDRDPAYQPPVGTVLNIITSNGRVTADDAFDSVKSPRYGTRKLRVAYTTNHVRLWVDRVG